MLLCGFRKGDGAAWPIQKGLPYVINTTAGNHKTIEFSFLSLPEVYYNACVIAKRWAPLVMVISFLVGFVIYDVFKKNKEIQKWAFSLLMLKIPLFVFIGVYVFSYLYGVLNL